MARQFYTLDVFTDTAFTGNPLAVVTDAEGLDDAAMQRIAREFNYSETVFVLPPSDPRHKANVRIFTTAFELPFAGHPTVGTAALLALLDPRTGATAFGLSEKIGTVPCVVEVESDARAFARFRLPQLPVVWGEGRESADCAWALGVDPTEIGFARHVPSRHTAGVAFDYVPLASADVLAHVAPREEAFEKHFRDGERSAIYAYARLPGEGLRFRARMLAIGMGMREDPATGSAAAGFAGALMQCEPLGDGRHDILIEQGVEMGRPSLISLQMTIENGTLTGAEIGGHAVLMARGQLLT
jgi:trans-2,3-dihydro-3-hydroxyanthranilate isomerase